VLASGHDGGFLVDSHWIARARHGERMKEKRRKEGESKSGEEVDPKTQRGKEIERLNFKERGSETINVATQMDLDKSTRENFLQDYFRKTWKSNGEMIN
jgi:hypothetical protein